MGEPKVEDSKNENFLFEDPKKVPILEKVVHIKHNGRFVFPQILGQDEDNWTMVEHLNGKDMADLMFDLSITVQKKLEILQMTVDQLITIDANDFVIFDRNPGNIFVESLDPLIVRQVDIEDLYDVNGDKAYTAYGASFNPDSLEDYKEWGLSIWHLAIGNIINIGLRVSETHKSGIGIENFSRLREVHDKFQNQVTLQSLKTSLRELQLSLEDGKDSTV
jgi:hypothetical protein